MPTPDRTSRSEIIAAGRILLEREGPSGVTMRAVADHVGVRAPSLYKRIADRDALLTAIVEDVIDDLESALSPHTGDLRSLAVAFRGFGHANPEGFRLLSSPLAPLDALQRAAAPVISSCAAKVGESEAALHAARMFTAWATGFLSMEIAGAFRLGGGVDAAFEYALAHIIAGITDSETA